ncbi:dipeptidase PepV [Lachnospiraceae bacterium EP-SM-12S-S03]|nr:dipeptidase PepV [Lachnospiraceae bacterium EP-SM-12S-S03]
MDFEAKIREDRESLIEDIKKLVSIDSVETAPEKGMPFGKGAADALQCFLDLAESLGANTENFDNYAGHADFGDGEETLGILGHMDVVPCGDGCLCDPFKPEVIDGKLYGRGVLDNKGPMAVCLHAVKILKEMGLPMKKKIRFIVGANEETDWKCVDYYFNQKKIAPPELSFTPDAEFPLNHAEKGVFQYQLITDLKEDVVLAGGNAFNSVAESAYVLLDESLAPQIQEKMAQWEEVTGCHFETETVDGKLTLTAHGFAAHAANPEGGKNAISAIMNAVHELHVGGELGEIAEFYMGHIGFNLCGEHIGVGLSDEVSGKLSFNVGKAEVIDGKLILSIDNRVPVSYKCKEAQELIEKNLEGTRFRFENPDIIEAIYVPKDSFLVQTLMDVYKEVTGEEEAEPQVDGACSYARALDNCVAFGALLHDQPNLMHQKNEYLELDKLDMWMKIYLEAIYRLAK